MEVKQCLTSQWKLVEHNARLPCEGAGREYMERRADWTRMNTDKNLIEARSVSFAK